MRRTSSFSFYLTNDFLMVAVLTGVCCVLNCRRIELALDLLGKSSPLAKDIAVGKHPPALGTQSLFISFPSVQCLCSCML